MDSFEGKITDAVDINTIGGGHFRLMPGRYRVTMEKNGGALLVRIDIKGAAQIFLTPVQWGYWMPRASLSASNAGNGQQVAVRILSPPRW